MKIPHRFVPFALLALVGAFTACDQRDSLATAAANESAASGAVAFRLADTLLSVVAKTSDSVRIEAVRDGFGTRIVSGSIGGNTVLTGLEAGAWTLKVATFDTLQSVSWYGEALVQIKAGKTVEAVIVLRRASGSVNVRIVLDTVPTPTDTLRWTVKPSTGSLPGYLPILKSWRTDSGISILTSLYCASVVVRQIPDSGTVFRFGYNLDIMAKCSVGTPGPVLVFVPWTNCGNVTLQDANGKATAFSAPSCYTVPLILEGNPSDTTRYRALPLDSAWRTEKGLYIATRYDYFQPLLVHNPAQSSLPRRLFLVGTPIKTFLPVELLPHVFFVPFPSTEDLEIASLANDTVIKLPGKTMIVDPPPPSTPDTVTVPYAMGDLADYEPLPVEGAWRTDSGLFIATRYDYFQPVVVATPTQTRLPSVLTLAGKPIKTVAPVPRAPHVVFVPFPRDWSVSIANLLNDSIIKLPGKPVVVDPPSVVDTVTVEWIEGNLAEYKPLPLERAWRTDAGIFIATRYDYFVPAVVHSPIQSSLPRRLYLVGTPINTFVAVKLLPHIVFVPFPATEDVIVSNLANDTVFKLPGKPVIVDPPPPSFPDTVTVPYIQGNVDDYEGIPADSAWRGAKGIYIATHYDDHRPVVVAKPTQTRYPQEIVLVGKPIQTLVAVKNLPHVVFVPFPSDWPVGVGNLLNDAVIGLPFSPLVDPYKDSAFVRYSLTVKGTTTGGYEILELKADGTVTRNAHEGVVDSGPTFQAAALPKDTLAKVRSILERSSTRHPGGLPAITASICPAGEPTNNRNIEYANGTFSSMFWSLSSYCGEYPAAWLAVDEVDRILRAAFASP